MKKAMKQTVAKRLFDSLASKNKQKSYRSVLYEN